MLRREMTEQEKISRKELAKKVKEIKSKNLCPTCYNNEYGGVYNDYTNKLLFEDNNVIAFLEEYPRSEGHTILMTKEHFEDISEVTKDVGTDIMMVTKAITKAIKDVLKVEKVYMCTMCDDGRNHLHFQLIPRETNGIIGSKVFIKDRGIFVEDEKIINELKKKIKELI